MDEDTGRGSDPELTETDEEPVDSNIANMAVNEDRENLLSGTHSQSGQSSNSNGVQERRSQG